jgi:hypothetical protein
MGGIFKSLGKLFGGGNIKSGNVQGLSTYNPATHAPGRVESLQGSLAAAQQKLATANAIQVRGGKPVDRQPEQEKKNKAIKTAQEEINAISKMISASSAPAPTPLSRNPGILGGPGAESQLAKYDQLSAEYNKLSKVAAPSRKNEPDLHNAHFKKLNKVRDDLVGLEASLLKNLWYAPAGYQAPAAPQTPQQQANSNLNPAPTAPTSTTASPAGNVAGITTILGVDTTKRGASGGGRRRGRMQTLLTGLGGDTESLG